MYHPALQSLFLALSHQPQRLEMAQKVVFLRARVHQDLGSLGGKLLCTQTFKPYADELLQSGIHVSQSSEVKEPVSCSLYLPTHQKEENLFNFARCMQWLETGGVVFASMENRLGAARFEKELQKLAGNIETYSKNKCRVFWATKSESLNVDLMKDWLARGAIQPLEGTDFVTQPGIFGWNKIDRGSQLLCEYLPAELPGSGADMGAGYGYLSCFILKKIKGVRKLALYEAESLALDVARLNVEKARSSVETSFHWQDLRGGLEQKNLDWIIMNPPFHEGGESNVELGKSFLSAAARALRPEGELYLVANLHLPYEGVIKENFRWLECCVQKSGFKILKARK